MVKPSERVSPPTVVSRISTAGKFIAFACVPVAALLAVLLFYSIFSLVHSPLRPNRATGHTIFWSEHGIHHYITRSDRDLEDALFLAFPIVLGVFGLAITMQNLPRILSGEISWRT